MAKTRSASKDAGKGKGKAAISTSQASRKSKLKNPVGGQQMTKKDSKPEKVPKKKPPVKKGTKKDNPAPASKKAAGKKTGKPAEFSLALLKELGGDADDFKMLQGIDDGDDNDEEMGFDGDDGGGKVSTSDVKNFLGKLGLEGFQGLAKEDDEEDDEDIGEGESSDDSAEADDGHDDIRSELKRMVDDRDEGANGTTKTSGDEPRKAGLDSSELNFHQGHNSSNVASTKPASAEIVRLVEEAKATMFGSWYDALKDMPTIKNVVVDKEKARSKLEEASISFDEFVGEGQRMIETAKDQDTKWLRTALTTGTLSDRIAARTLMIQQYPLFCIHHMTSMMSTAQKGSKREAHLAIEALRDLFVNNLLPSDRKLSYFHEHPVTARGVSKLQLMYWVYEDRMKRLYGNFVQALEQRAAEPISHFKGQVLKTVALLLQEKPEQEKVLLAILVNKLGDPERKIASQVVYLLHILIEKHPNMKGVVVKSVHDLLLRPNMSDRGKYYGVICLNQVVLGPRDEDVAGRLISVYFVLFKALVHKGAVDTKMLSALLTGVNRAYPFTSVSEALFDEHVDALFKIVHTAPFNTGVQALALLYFVMSKRQTVSDRFYRALYSILLSSELRKSSKIAILLNLLHKALKADGSVPRTQAFVKRLLQVGFHCNPSTQCGILFLISSLAKARAGLLSSLEQPEENDSEEHFSDADDSADEGKKGKGKGEGKDDDDDQSKEAAVKKTGYDPRARDPLYARAEQACLWELPLLVRHYHPSVVAFATQLMEGQTIEYQGDPIKSFTTTAFLDRFVYRNPKQTKNAYKGSSYMQPMSGKKKAQPLVNTEEFLKQDESKVRADEVFFFKYFQAGRQRKTKKELKKEAKQDDAADEDSIDDDEFLKEMGDGIIDDGFDDDDFSSSYGSDKVADPKGGDSDSDGEFPIFNDSDDSEEPMDLDDQEGAALGFDAAEAGDDDDDDDKKKKKKKKKKDYPTFMDADEFQRILDTAGTEHPDVNPKQLAWEQRGEKAGRTGGKRGRRSGAKQQAKRKRAASSAKGGKPKGKKPRKK